MLNEQIISRIKNALIWFSSTIAVSLVFTALMVEFERGHKGFETWDKILWWWIVTISGLGGDHSPETLMGKFFGGLVILTSLFLLAIVIAEVSVLFRMIYEQKEKGIIRVRYSGHIVIYGYTSLTAGIIKLLRNHYGKTLKIVLISNDTDKNPFPQFVDFISTNPISKSAFTEANVKNAAAAIILANDRFHDPDSYSLVIASAISRNNSDVVMLVEIQNDYKKDLFKELSIDGFINRNELLKDLLGHKSDSKVIRIINKQSTLDEAVENNDKIDLI